jgi:hypothetical protein
VPALRRRVDAAVEALRAAGAELRVCAGALAPHVARFYSELADRLALYYHDATRRIIRPEIDAELLINVNIPDELTRL